MNTSLLFLGLIFSSLGAGYCLYARRQRAATPLVCGVLLIVGPYFVTNALAMIAAGAVVAAVPFFVKR